eukprot:CFRG7382T1
MTWTSLGVRPSELRLDVTLHCGQSFSWISLESGVWANVINNQVISLTQTDTDVLFRLHNTPIPEANAEETIEKARVNLRDYFQLDVCLSDLYNTWIASDENLKQYAKVMPGLRMLRQDPIENVFSFICSSNNNISRITQMVHTMKRVYGMEITHNLGEETRMYAFPTITVLSSPNVDGELRELGFGYRAKFVQGTAAKLINEHHTHERALEWLLSLRDKDYDEVSLAVQKLPGVGPKVADCVCLMSLDKTAAIPVDTHVWAIAQPYMPQLKGKTLTKTLYKQIGDFYRQLHGEYAGWAHSILFSGELKRFEDKVGKKQKASATKKKITISKSETKRKQVKSETVEKNIATRQCVKLKSVPSVNDTVFVTKKKRKFLKKLKDENEQARVDTGLAFQVTKRMISARTVKNDGLIKNKQSFEVIHEKKLGIGDGLGKG